ncbi:MAG TPA: CRISPR-associated protein Cas4 [Pyrinomonadaceae bacterium]|nr:CRISPR-associated protein Cas4 [Pyrinomonadaceae bacterium]
MAITFLSLAFVLLLLTAAAAWLASRRGERRAGLPKGRIIYSDTGAPVGRIAPVALNERGERQEKPLLSHRHGLVGRPDYLVRTEEGVVPVEAKSTTCPANGVPYESHLMQLACYCLLVEETTGAGVPFGVIRYRDRQLRVDYTDELRAALLALLAEMREARRAADVHRSHDERARCAACSYREICDESLAD